VTATFEYDTISVIILPLNLTVNVSLMHNRIMLHVCKLIHQQEMFCQTAVPPSSK